MSTLHLIIVCISVLLLALLLTRSARERRPSLSEQGNVLAGQIAVAIARKLNDDLQTIARLVGTVAVNTAIPETEAPAPSRLGETVAVRTRPPDATTVRGVVAAEHTDRIVLREAVVYDGGTEGKSAAGLIEIHRLNISTVQVIPALTEPA